MDKKEFLEKAEKALNQAFEATKKSMKVVAEKAGEATHITKLLVEKVSLEHRMSRQFARIGSSLYEKAVRQGKDTLLQSDGEIRDLLEETREVESALARIEATLETERKQKRSPARSAGKASPSRRK